MNYKFTLIFIVILSIIISGCINDDNHENNDYWEKEIIHYEIEIKSNNSYFYEVYLPVPLISRVNNPKKGTPIQLMNEIHDIYGSANYELINTIYGYALYLNSTSDLLLRGHKEFINESTKNDNDYVFDELSLKLNEKYNSPYFIYFNSSRLNNVQLTLNSYYFREHTKGSSNFQFGCANYNLSNGWQEIELYMGGTIAG